MRDDVEISLFRQPNGEQTVLRNVTVARTLAGSDLEAIGPNRDAFECALGDVIRVAASNSFGMESTVLYEHVVTEGDLDRFRRHHGEQGKGRYQFRVELDRGPHIASLHIGRDRKLTGTGDDAEVAFVRVGDDEIYRGEVKRGGFLLAVSADLDPQRPFCTVGDNLHVGRMRTVNGRSTPHILCRYEIQSADFDKEVTLNGEDDYYVRLTVASKPR
jgi:hypothetical protein